MAEFMEDNDFEEGCEVHVGLVLGFQNLAGLVERDGRLKRCFVLRKSRGV